MIFCYNKAAVGDTLFVVVAPADGQAVTVERRGPVARVYQVATQQTVGWNIFDVSEFLPQLSGKGQVQLTADDVTTLNQVFQAQQFPAELVTEQEPHFVVGYVDHCEPHPNSDHLSITQTRVGENETLQIVCGAKNIAEGQTVVVAKPGAMMPDGQLIWPGELRGVASNGMICSARELGLAQTTPGILVLEDAPPIGSAFKG